MTNNRIIIRPTIAQKFQNCMEQGRIFFISAPCGFGKTATAEALTAGYRTRRMSGKKTNLEEALNDPEWEILLVDDLQQMQEEEDLITLCDLIRERSKCHYVLLSRGILPGCQ